MIKKVTYSLIEQDITTIKKHPNRSLETVHKNYLSKFYITTFQNFSLKYNWQKIDQKKMCPIQWSIKNWTHPCKHQLDQETKHHQHPSCDSTDMKLKWLKAEVLDSERRGEVYRTGVGEERGGKKKGQGILALCLQVTETRWKVGRQREANSNKSTTCFKN